ncbi:hypothetical protein SO802_034694 [Lithocarpus litseifolius]|uniref:Uncharacterized protein n=1 Tax=Lithocarpus litseifolius TaxID=425828 RepID=A0AAW2BJL6_9ROSI
MASLLPMQRLFFYELPCPTDHFKQTTLPILKHSLSLTFQHFFPLASNLIFPPQPLKPHFLYTDGDSALLTITECMGDFDHIIANYPRDARDLHPFVPQLNPALVLPDNTRVVPLMALQLTVFPNSGICIGVTFCHVAADGRSFHHFMKSWASLCRRTIMGDLDRVDSDSTLLPFHNRDVIKDPDGLESKFIEEWWNWASTWKEDTRLNNDVVADKVRATFVLGQAHIRRLKHKITTQCVDEELEPLHISTFVVTCALIWVCLIKSQDSRESKFSDIDNEKVYYFGFVADCRNRLEFPIPSTYFGNCLAICFVSLKRC